MHAAAKMLRGGVAHDATRLRGQSMVEYVLLIAIIGLVVVFAGPHVAGAIRNQFSAATNTVDGGTEGDNFISAEEKAYREAMKNVVNKDAKDWTLDEQKAAATDISKNGTASVIYAKAKAAMDAGTKFSVKLTDGQTLRYRIIGINHDDLADGSGKAGLTFEAKDPVGGVYSNTPGNSGGWEASRLRQDMNSGKIWNLMPSGLQEKIKAVNKLTDNCGNEKLGVPTFTTDKVFLLSVTEVYGDLKSDGSQYEFYRNKGVTKDNFSGAKSTFGNSPHGTRSVVSSSWRCYWGVRYTGEPTDKEVADTTTLCHLAWCF